MKFQFGSRWRSGQLTIRPSKQLWDPGMQQWIVTQGLTVHIADHRVDTISEQKKWQWSDEERELVEKRIQAHKQWGRSDGRGIFASSEATLVRPKSVAALEESYIAQAKKLVRRCIFKEDLGDEIIQCTNTVDKEEEDYCETHREMVKAAQGAADLVSG